MATFRKTITITKKQNDWIKSQIKSGDFTNESEYIRGLVRRDQANSAEIAAIRSELIKGENSGEPRPLDSNKFKKRMTKKRGKRI